MRRAPEDAHGVSQREQQILELTDAGECPKAVAAALFIGESYVRWVMKCYSGSWRDNDRQQAAVRRSCALYGQRLAQAGGCYL